MVVWHVTTEIMLVIIYLLEDKKEVSLGMLIRPKRIYNFCLLHACFVLLCHVLLELSYTFEHIWTNLLTQCTQLPVPVFCCFCISGFPAIKSAPKILEKIYKKSASRKLPESPRKEGRATTGTPERSLARPHPRPRRAPSWLPCAPLVPPFVPIFTPAEETLIQDPFSPEEIPISAAIAIKFRGDRIPVSAPCRDGEVPSGIISIAVSSSLHDAGVVPPRG